MGLDMYLHGTQYFGYDHPNRKLSPPISEIRYDLGYWRKHPNLHGYIVETFADGKDECQEIPLEEGDILKIIDAVVADSLPTTTGFFFGVTDGTEREETLQILRDALTWLRAAEGYASRSVYYCASW